MNYIEEDLEYTELCRQEYKDCKFSAGFVDGHPVDKIYLKIERNSTTDVLVLLRPDEAAAIAWVITGALWSHEYTN